MNRLENVFSNENFILEKDDYYNEDIVKSIIHEANGYCAPLLTLEEEHEIIMKIHNGDFEARDFFIKKNLCLVISVVKKYLGKGVKFEDLFQEGCIGLIKTIEDFDLSKNNKFSSYAIYWIRYYIVKTIMKNGKNIKLPMRFYHEFKRIRKIKETLEKELKREATYEEILEYSNVSKEFLNVYFIYENDTISLNQLVLKDNSLEYIDQLSFNDLEEEYIYNKMMKEELTLIVKELGIPRKHFEIFLYKNGLIDGKVKTLDETGRVFNFTGERIRQIISDIYKSLREYEKITKLVMYLDDPQKGLDNINKFRDLYQRVGSDSFRAFSNIDINNLDVDDLINNMNLKNEKRKKGRNNENHLLKLWELLECTKEEAYLMLNYLSREERYFVINRYGGDIENPRPNPLFTHEDRRKFYGGIVGKMKRIIMMLRENNKENVNKKVKNFHS